MPVSVACESSANVNAALRESLGGGGIGVGYAAAATIGADDTKAASANVNIGGGGASDLDSFQDKLVASAKRVLLNKVEYEESNNYGHTVLDTLKSKYFVLKGNPAAIMTTANNNNNNENGHNSSSAPATGNSNHSKSNGNIPNGDCAAGMIVAENNNNNHIKKNPHQLPQPKCVLYPRDNVRVGWKSTNRKWLVGSGMTNVGNTCYLNSTLQALFHVPAFANWLMSDTQHVERCDGADSGCIICSMVKTLQSSQSGQGSIRPYCIYSKLKSICKHLVMGRQEDAHEFLRYLVETMERQYLMRYRNFKELDQFSKETTPINHILGGYVKTAVNCLKCGHVSVTFQHIQDILLDIRKSDSIDDALDGYFSCERLEDLTYKCESCKIRVLATKQFSLERAPVVLCLQLKRFSMLGTKMNKHITIKPSLDLSRFSSATEHAGSLKYRLVAMITHLGASQHCGHYTAVGLTESGVYYNFDDSYVHPISMQTVTNTNAYVIFYERENLPKISNGMALKYAAESKENNVLEANGKSSGDAVIMPQRIIGPQLPLGGLTNAGAKNTTAHTNGVVTSNKNGANRHNNGTPNGSSKLLIKYKHEADTSSSTSSSTAANKSADGRLIFGTGKFHESTNSQSPLVGPSDKGHSAAVANGHNGRSHNSSAESLQDDEEDDEVSSTTPNAKTTKTSQLPSMPKLFDLRGTSEPGAPSTSSAYFGKKAEKSVVPKSLVPYESESGDDDSMADGDFVGVKSTSASAIVGHKQLQQRSKLSQRRNSDDSAFSDDNDLLNGPEVLQHVIMKRSASATPCSTRNLHKKSNGLAHSDGEEEVQMKSLCKSPTKTTTTTKVIDDIFSRSRKPKNSAASGCHSDGSLAAVNGSDGTPKRAPIKRSLSSSPPHVETKTGIWKVTELKKTPVNTAEATKNTKNPFATTKPSGDSVASPSTGQFIKRTKLNGHVENARPQNGTVNGGTGYRLDTGNQNVAAELSKQSHRGYGAPVLTWSGTQTEIEQETNNVSLLRDMDENENDKKPTVAEVTAVLHDEKDNEEE